jgi:hypothetical protein
MRHFAVCTKDPTIRGDAINNACSVPNVGDALSLPGGVSGCLGNAWNHLCRELVVQQFPRQACCGSDCFGSEVAPRGVVLMERLDCHSLRRGAAGRCDGGAPLLVTGVADAYPINRRQDDRRLTVGEHHETARREEIVYASSARNQAEAQGRARGGRCVDGKRADSQLHRTRGRRTGSGKQSAYAAAEHHADELAAEPASVHHRGHQLAFSFLGVNHRLTCSPQNNPPHHMTRVTAREIAA